MAASQSSAARPAQNHMLPTLGVHMAARADGNLQAEVIAVV
jgi:hypothetical protein